MELHVLSLVLGNLHIGIFINHSPNGFYFYRRQLTTRLKNILLSNFQRVEVCSTLSLAVGLNHLPFGGYDHVVRTGKEKYRAQYECGCGHYRKLWRMNDFLSCRIVNKGGIMSDFRKNRTRSI